MRGKKWVFIAMTIMTMISFLVCFVSTKRQDDFIKDISLAIFGSAFLSAIISFLEYLNERQSCMLQFYLEGSNLLNALNKIVLLPSKLVNDEDQVKKAARSYLEFAKQDSEGINIAYIQLDFLLDNKWKKNVVYKKIYMPLWSILYTIKDNKKMIEIALQEDIYGRLRNTVIGINKHMMREKDYGDGGTKSWNAYSDDICKELELFRDKMYFHSKKW